MARAVIYQAEHGRDILGLSREQYTTLDRLMRRYYTWVQGGRKFDPWQSGVSGASRFDQPNSKHHRSNGSFGPGRCSEPEVPTDLMRIDDVLPTCSALDRVLFEWHWRIEPPLHRPLRIEEMVERLSISVDQYKGDWNRAKTKLFCKLSGL